ncbi:MAG TPA: PspC domain-containing protein [Thermoclostridium sp.]|nr:PspC domain-containing protein [Thermoclostridium sp.]
MKKKLYLSDSNKVVGGVCGGIGEYLEVDPTIVRLIWVIMSFFFAIIGGALLYLIAMVIIPRKYND